MFQDISIEELIELQINKDITLIDVRSEGEYNDFTIPNSLNIPLFNDEERKVVGTLYKQVSIRAAKDKGLEIVSRKLPQFIKQFEAIDARKAVFCWRGGMRSKTTATVLSLMGVRVYRLDGGIRNYRKWVVKTLEEFEFKPKCIVLNGYTGTGKTEILKQLADKGYPILDLEGLAQHRGSIFGQIGLQPNNQKTFESLLVHELIRVNEEPFVFIEAESRRIGKVVLPEFLTQAKERGKVIFVDLPMKERVRHIIRQYEPREHKAECMTAFMRIKKSFHTPIGNEIEKFLQQDQFAEAVTLMLEHYYDSRYDYTIEQYEKRPKVIAITHIDEAADLILDELQEIHKK